jgi:hypothetical protein
MLRAFFRKKCIVPEKMHDPIPDPGYGKKEIEAIATVRRNA